MEEGCSRGGTRLVMHDLRTYCTLHCAGSSSAGHTRLVFAGDAWLHIRQTHVDMVKEARPPKHMSAVMRELSCAVLH